VNQPPLPPSICSVFAKNNDIIVLMIIESDARWLSILLVRDKTKGVDPFDKAFSAHFAHWADHGHFYFPDFAISLVITAYRFTAA
jgi:hypothetical protein